MCDTSSPNENASYQCRHLVNATASDQVCIQMFVLLLLLHNCHYIHGMNTV